MKRLCGILLNLCLVFLMSGCASRSRQWVLADALEQPQPDAYFVAKSAATGNPSADAADKDLLDDAQQQLMQSKARWEAALTNDVRPATLAGLGPEESAAYRKLAVDPNLDAQLAAAIDLATLAGLAPGLNPTIKAAAAQVRATLEQYPQAAQLDNILQQYNAFTKQLETRVGPTGHKQMAAMSFPFPDALALKGKLIDEAVELARRQHEIAVRDVVTELSEAYCRLLFADASIAVNKENQALLEQGINVALQEIRSGDSSSNVVIMAQVELATLGDAVITLEAERETLIARLNSLLGRLPSAVLGPPAALADSDLDIDLETLYDFAIDGRQELQEQRLRIARMRTTVTLARRMAYPDPTMGPGYFENRMRLSSGTDEDAPAFTPQRDLDHRETPWFGQRDAYIREVEVRIEGMQSSLAAMEDQTRFAVKQAHSGLETARRRIALYRTSLLPQARQSLDNLDSAYRSGKTDFLNFLDAQRTLLQFRLEEQRAFLEFRLHLTRLDQLAGRALPRKSLTIDQETDQ